MRPRLRKELQVKLPTRLSGALGVALTGLIAVAQETHWSHEDKQAVVIVGGLVLAWLVHPGEGGVTSSSTSSPPTPTPPPGI